MAKIFLHFPVFLLKECSGHIRFFASSFQLQNYIILIKSKDSKVKTQLVL